MFRKLLVCSALVAGSAAANAGTLLLDEGFENLGTTNPLDDWFSLDLSNPACSPVATPGCAYAWDIGNSGVFDAQAGSAESYLASSAFSAAPGGNIDNWLITPLLHNSSVVLDLNFWTRTEGALPGDNLEVMVNDGNIADLADWHSLGGIGAYPSDWSLFNFEYSGSASDVRFAFRYTVTDTSQNGDYI